MYCDDPLLGNWNFLVWMVVLIWITIYSTLTAEFEMIDIKRDHCSEIINLPVSINTKHTQEKSRLNWDFNFTGHRYYCWWVWASVLAGLFPNCMSFSFYINDNDTPLYIEMILLLSFTRQEDIIWQYYIVEITERDTHYEQPVLKKQIFKLKRSVPFWFGNSNRYTYP